MHGKRAGRGTNAWGTRTASAHPNPPCPKTIGHAQRWGKLRFELASKMTASLTTPPVRWDNSSLFGTVMDRFPHRTCSSHRRKTSMATATAAKARTVKPPKVKDQPLLIGGKWLD